MSGDLKVKNEEDFIIDRRLGTGGRTNRAEEISSVRTGIREGQESKDTARQTERR